MIHLRVGDDSGLCFPDTGRMKVTRPGTAASSNDSAVEMSPEGKAEIARLQSERALMEGKMRLEEEDPFAKVERLHQNAIASLPAIGSKSPLANVGKGPQAGDPGVGKVTDFVPVSVKA